MPKLVQCANCRKAFLGTSYTLMEHYQKCITEKIVKNKPAGHSNEIKNKIHPDSVGIKHVKINNDTAL